MPCDQIQIVSVEWSMKSTDLALLTAALNALGKEAVLDKGSALVSPRIRFAGGVFQDGKFKYTSTYYARISQQQAAQEVAKLKQAYGAEAVKATAKKWGWQIKETAPFEYEVVKR